MRSAWIIAAALAGLVAASSAGSQPAPVAEAGQARGEAIFKERCKDCHDPAVERAPTREELAAKTPAQIVEALTTGPMTPIAEGLTPQDKQAVAAYLTAH
jgi:mono/diheme cytochrome c family protein